MASDILPECPKCGCPDVEIVRAPHPDHWFASGLADCNHCGHRFGFREQKDPDAFGTETQQGPVIYQPVRCPVCRSKDVPIQHTEVPIRYHRCRSCGERFKSVEKIDE